MQLSNNTLLITGGSSGIGLALARRFHQLQNKVIITGRDATKLEAVAAQYPGMEYFAGDLSRAEEVNRLVDFLSTAHPGLNLLINNAAIQYMYAFTEEKQIREKVNYEITTNLTSLVQLCGLLLPVLMKNTQPAIVNVSSGLALAPKKTAPVYCATKAAVHHFTKAFRYQLESTPVKVFEILPAVIDTPMTAGRGTGKISPDQLVDEFLSDFRRNRYESYIGKTKLLRLIQRISPALADRIMKNG